MAAVLSKGETFREMRGKVIGMYEKDSARGTAINKYKFYERASKAYAVVTTSETVLYADIILQKGVVMS